MPGLRLPLILSSQLLAVKHFGSFEGSPFLLDGTTGKDPLD